MNLPLQHLYPCLSCSYISMPKITMHMDSNSIRGPMGRGTGSTCSWHLTNALKLAKMHTSPVEGFPSSSAGILTATRFSRWSKGYTHQGTYISHLGNTKIIFYWIYPWDWRFPAFYKRIAGFNWFGGNSWPQLMNDIRSCLSNTMGIKDGSFNDLST